MREFLTREYFTLKERDREKKLYITTITTQFSEMNFILSVYVCNYFVHRLQYIYVHAALSFGLFVKKKKRKRNVKFYCIGQFIT